MAKWTLTLQNQVCYICYRRAGFFHWFHSECDRLRRPKETIALREQAVALHPTSKTQQAKYLQPFGLHVGQSPCDDVGLDLHAG